MLKKQKINTLNETHKKPLFLACPDIPKLDLLRFVYVQINDAKSHLNELWEFNLERICDGLLGELNTRIDKEEASLISPKKHKRIATK